MVRNKLRLLAVLLALALLLSGCSFLEHLYAQLMSNLNSSYMTPFSEMEYQRPDFIQLSKKANHCASLAESTDDLDALVESINDFYIAYNDFYTNYALANIYYCKDLTDIYWEQEYTFCAETAAQAEALRDSLNYTLADCPLKEELEGEEYFGEGFFDDFTGESIWDKTFTAMMEQEAQLISRYYQLSEQSLEEDTYSESFYTGTGRDMAELLAELVKLRQTIATQAGYESYVDFAYDFYYDRDYTAAQATDYLADISTTLTPLYRKLATMDIYSLAGSLSFAQQTYSYVQETATALGGIVEEAFLTMDSLKLYDIDYGETKYNASFEVFLPNYASPFIFMCPTLYARDQLTFAHEFGHFCNDYASGGSIVGIDVAEIFSQGMEYLSLSCVEGREQLTKLKMADSLAIYIEQAAYASFEQQMYSLSEAELNADSITNLYGTVGTQFGFDSFMFDQRDFVFIGHFFTNPMYVISYVVSNDAALQLYQLEQAQPGAGKQVLENNLATTQPGFLAFLEEAGLESPFAEGRLESVKMLLESVFK